LRTINRALVLGGGGFLGAHVVSALHAQGAHVVVVDARAPEPGSPAGDAELVLSPVGQGVVRDLVIRDDVDAVFHLAGSSFVPPSIDDPLGDLERNVGNTLHVLEAVRRSGRSPVVAYVSSAAVYGHGIRMPMDEEHPFEPVSPYGVAKLASEAYLAQYHRLHDLAGFSVRPFSLYGPWQRKLVVHDLIVRALGGEQPLSIAAPADVSRDYVFGADAGAALVALAAAAPAQGEAYNIATGVETPLCDLAETIVSVVAPGTDIEFSGTLRPGDPLRWSGDPARAAGLGAVCDTSLSEGIAGTVDWLRRA
jgi:UDP-glucose 4-epimerase